MKRLMVGLAASVLFNGMALAEVVHKDVEYAAGGVKMKGYLAYDNAIEGQRPGVLVVHEWWGLNDYARSRARQLAELGYTALALDMYGNGKEAGHPEDAGKFSGEVKANMGAAEQRFRAALELLQKQPSVNPADIAAIGYCFGGGVVLEMARRGVDLDAVVSFHGSLGTDSPTQPGKVKARLLVLAGGADPFVPAEQVAAFEKEMKAAGVDYRLISYPGAKHAFTNPEATANGQKFGLPLEYNEMADKASWLEMQHLFSRVFEESAD